MRITLVTECIKRLAPDVEIRISEPMRKHTSFRIGGNAEIMALPRTEKEAALVMRACRICREDFFVLGNGTNVLAAENGIDCIVIKPMMTDLRQIGETTLYAQSGVLLSKLALEAMKLGLTGLEFAHGIPGSVGGAVFMNAGAYDGQIKDVVVRTDYIDEDGVLKSVSEDEQEFDYRKSFFSQREGLLITGAVFSLKKGNVQEIKEKMDDLMAKRKASQPLDLPSAGSTFKRPAEGYAAALIDRAGLKGLRIGGAEVSTKHAGFIVNAGNATSEDVRKLMHQVQERVYENSGIWLEPEIKFLGGESR